MPSPAMLEPFLIAGLVLAAFLAALVWTGAVARRRMSRVRDRSDAGGGSDGTGWWRADSDGGD